MVGSVQRVHSLEFTRHQNDSIKLNAIAVTGEVRNGDAQRLKDYISTLSPKANIAVYLNSPGGSLYEGMQLGRVFMSMRIKTVVEGNEMCASACALAFLGGRDRQGKKWMSSTTTSRLGFHAFRNGDGTKTDNTDNTQLIVSHVLQYGKDVDAPIDILIRAFGTSASDMYWFSEDELLQLGVKIWDMSGKCFVPCKGAPARQARQKYLAPVNTNPAASMPFH